MSEESILSIPVKPEEHKDVWIFAEVRHGKLQPTAFELLGIGRTLANDLGEKLCAVIIGKGVTAHTQALIEAGADKVFVLDHPWLEQFVDELYTNLLVELLVKE